MDTISVGRTLDERGEPIPGSGFEIDPAGDVAATLDETTGPLVSNPVSGEWVAELDSPEATGGAYLSGLYLIAGDGPPPH
jgi:hypothetical protein